LLLQHDAPLLSLLPLIFCGLEPCSLLPVLPLLLLPDLFALLDDLSLDLSVPPFELLRFPLLLRELVLQLVNKSLLLAGLLLPLLDVCLQRRQVFFYGLEFQVFLLLLLCLSFNLSCQQRPVKIINQTGLEEREKSLGLARPKRWSVAIWGYQVCLKL